MKIKEIILDNFANFGEFSCSLSDGVNYIQGSNGSGKSTVGTTAICACLKGIAERGDVLKGKRFMWVGKNGTDANVTVVLKDRAGVEYTVSREISENKLRIASSDGRKLDQKWINELFSELMLSPIAFSRLTPKEQAQFMGIDTSTFDNAIRELKEDATFLRREVKNFGEIEIPEKVESVDVGELNEEKNRIIRFNQEQEQLERRRDRERGEIASLEMEERRLVKLLEETRDFIESKRRVLGSIPKPEPLVDTTSIDQKISEASKVNALAHAYNEAVRRQIEKDTKQQELDDNLARQKAEMDRKVAYMQGLDLPASNLMIDEDGGLTMDGRPISSPHFSTGELIKICTMLMASRAPEWNYIFLQEFDLLDEGKAAEVLKWLSERDYQVLCERVVSNQPEIVILQDVNN